jgi:hypothetical protein
MRRRCGGHGLGWGTIAATQSEVTLARERIAAHKDFARVLGGLFFLGSVFSVFTWHLWLEHKASLLVWMVCLVATLAAGLLVPDRTAIYGLLIFFGSYLSYGRSWQWLHGEVPAYVPLLWILGIVLALALAPKWKIALGAALGMWALLSLKAVLLDREPRAIYITAIACALIFGLLLTTRHGDS